MKTFLLTAVVLLAGGSVMAQAPNSLLKPPGVIIASSGNNYYPTLGVGPAAQNAWMTSGFYSPSFIMQRSRIQPINPMPQVGAPTRPLLPTEMGR